jgi:glutamine cyclotransferase
MAPMPRSSSLARRVVAPGLALAVAAVVVLAPWPLAASGGSPSPARSAAPSAAATAPGGSSAAATPVAGATSPSASLSPVEVLTYDVVSRRPHDAGAWTEGLLLDPQGRLFESTGLEGRSSLREVDPQTGAVLRSAALEGALYGEGIALVGDRIVQLTWKDGRALVWDANTFARLGEHAYSGEGWGLCHDGSRLVQSDGSDVLTFRDPDTFATVGSVRVTLLGQPVIKLNELECVDGQVWANVWETPYIVRIDPGSGQVTGVLDATGILEPDPSATNNGAVLNGIAWDPVAGTFLLTGKLWPELIEVRARTVRVVTPSVQP